MFLVIQHPFADLRSLLGGECGRLSRPSWPLAEPEKDFIRSSGLVRPRRRGGVDEWAGEELYGDASGSFRFPNSLKDKSLGTGAAAGFVDHAIRRFHSDGTVARLDVGLRLRLSNRPSVTSETEWLSLLRDALEIPVCVRDAKRQSQSVKLIAAGDVLAQHFLVATTDRRLRPTVEPQTWWFCSGNPALLVEYRLSDLFVFPPHTRHVLDVLDVRDADASLSHAWLQIDKQRCSVWLVRQGEGDPDAVRRLRIHLARLHAERECLRLVLFHIKDNKFDLGKNPERLDAIQQYLNDALRTIQRPERFGLAQSAMLDAARQALGIAFEGQTTSLQLMRRQVAVKVEGYVRRAQNIAMVINNIQGDVMNTNIQMGNVSVTGDFNLVTATNIQNSYNKTANSGVRAELVEKLKLAILEVASLARKLPQEDAEKLSKDLEILTSEAVSRKPRKEWYELSAKGIMEAAKTIEDMVAPVTTAVKAVLALLET